MQRRRAREKAKKEAERKEQLERINVVPAEPHFPRYVHPANKVPYHTLETFLVANAALAGYPAQAIAVAAAAESLLVKPRTHKEDTHEESRHQEGPEVRRQGDEDPDRQ
jgi:hypothetical protein